MMDFNEWIIKLTGMTWREFKAKGTTDEQRHKLYRDFCVYCEDNGIEGVFRF